MKFMRLIIQGPEPAFYNMALDEAVTEAVLQKNSPPTLRLYQWERPSVSIGHFQKISEINTAYCIKNDYPVVRRLTGGRAILHDAELTYSLSSLTDSLPFNSSLLDNYKVISSALIAGLKLIGIHAEMSFVKKRAEGLRNSACFKAMSFGEVTVDGRKIIGSAQKRYNNGFLQHGSILLSFNSDELCHIVNHNASRDFEGIGAINKYAPEISIHDLKSSLKEAFEKELNMKLITDSPSKAELSHAKALQRDKYSNAGWNYRR